MRAGYSPVCFDLFADADLAAMATVKAIPLADWPFAILPYLKSFFGMPFLYTGGLENHPGFLDQVAKTQPFWGNTPDIYQPLRDPFYLNLTLQSHGIRFPELGQNREKIPDGDDWLLKPLASAGGMGIRQLSFDSANHSEKWKCPQGYYAQKRIPGEDISVSFLLNRLGPRVLMVSRGNPLREDLGVPGMGYAGNHFAGTDWQPLDEGILEKLGGLLWNQGLRGLVGVDGKIDDQGHFFLLEVNPRYTASMELGEMGLNIPFAKLHVDCFTSPVGDDKSANSATNKTKFPHPDNTPRTKSIFYARKNVHFSPDIKWPEKWISLEERHQVTLCDLPSPGTIVAKGAPILTIIEKGTPWANLRERFRPILEDLRNQLEH